MKRLIPTIVILCLVLHANGQIERDKVLHFVGGNLFGLVGAGVAKKASDGNRTWTFIGSVAGATLIGIAKEAVDASQQDNGWDNDDLVATILGGITVGLTIELFSKKKNGRLRYAGRAAIEDFESSFLFTSVALNEPDGELPRLTSFGFLSHLQDTLFKDYHDLTQ